MGGPCQAWMGSGASPLPLGGMQFSLLCSGNNGMSVCAADWANGLTYTEGNEVHRIPQGGTIVPAPARHPPPFAQRFHPQLLTAPVPVPSCRDSAQGGTPEPLTRVLSPGWKGASNAFYVLQHEDPRGRGARALTLVGDCTRPRTSVRLGAALSLALLGPAFPMAIGPHTGLLHSHLFLVPSQSH